MKYLKNLKLSSADMLRGSLIYATGDTVAALLTGDFTWMRLLGMLFLGGTLYAFEIPNYFRWIDRRVKATAGLGAALQRTALAMLYFNPLWIARHILFLKICMGQYEQIGWPLIAIGFWSFLLNIPLSLAANFLIQNKVQLRWRFVASAVFSALMAVYYAWSAVWLS